MKAGGCAATGQQAKCFDCILNADMCVISAKCKMQIAIEIGFPPIDAEWPCGISHLANLKVFAH